MAARTGHGLSAIGSTASRSHPCEEQPFDDGKLMAIPPSATEELHGVDDDGGLIRGADQAAGAELLRWRATSFFCFFIMAA